MKRNILPFFLKLSWTSAETEAVTFSEQVCAWIFEQKKEMEIKSNTAFFIGKIEKVFVLKIGIGPKSLTGFTY